MAKRRRDPKTAAMLQKTQAVLLAPGLVAVFVFFIICLCAESTAPDTAVVMSMAALAAALIGFRRLRERLSLPMAALTALVLWSFIASLYAQSGAIAKLEIVKIAASFGVTVVLLVLARGKEAEPGQWLASVLAGAAALMSLISIDLLSTRLLSGLFQGIMGLFSGSYASLEGVEAGVRMTSIVENPNVFAGCAGIGVLLSLGLSQTADKAGQKRYSLCCLYLNALGFVLAFSMGGTAMIALGFAVYLLLERRGHRGRLFVTMLLTLVLTLAGVAAVSVTSLDVWDGFQLIPLLCAVVGAAALCLADRFVAPAVTGLIAKGGKWLTAAAAVVLAALILLAVFACIITCGVRLEAGETLRRAVQVTGDCSLTYTAQGDVTVKVESQNRQQTITHAYTVLYEGPLSETADGFMTVAVPEDTLVVWLEFTAGRAAELSEVALGGVKVPLGYPLLPDFIANRLQGLWANQNAIQRLAFFSDGLKLFARSPVVGLGLGSFENGLLSVQSFYYEARHVHNHYIQLLSDMGIVGLLLFLTLLAVSAHTVLKARRSTSCHGLIPALGAVLVFMAGHAAVEVVFSYFAYIPFAFAVFALIGLCSGQDVLSRGKTVKNAAASAVAAVVFAMMVTLLISSSAADAASRTPSPQVMVSSAKKDPYHWSDYTKAYLGGALTMKDNAEYLRQADAFAARMAASDDRTLHTSVAAYYFQTGREAQAMEQLERAITLNRSAVVTWDEVFAILAEYESDTALYKEGVDRIGAFLAQWMEESLTPVELQDSWTALLDRVSPGWNEG